MGDPFIMLVRVITIVVYTQGMGYSFGGGPAWSAFNKTHYAHPPILVLGSKLPYHCSSLAATRMPYQPPAKGQEAQREQEIIDLTNNIVRNGYIYFPEFCKVILKKFREDDEELFNQNMFKVDKMK